jgi:thiamine pyrophosphate-dependent acetolactate synthase large subunit-like protein
MQENLRYDKVAEAFGVRGEYVRTPEELRAALRRSYAEAAKNGTPTLIAAQAIKEFTNGKLYPPGFAPWTEPGVGANMH